ncbi:C_GCAxxG_C_C family probable redox protein [Lachnospiraceae bacterium PF1-21]|uniref:C-GCAxxG-C-C family protein n=1 Tax=Ohessyouella blattaphilus TaxID=2949333 RepID=A0ABT1EK92_9FIRM|nr:C-GCAxxG-C-C family (seleno)protein [Ohessyouella blattaphilus]MCP1111119.1 C-GCAxxG-C-C family protein [Ohessyouella blattaphilus]MCR8564513.1 C-GCAxxG-C-C family protein [Ohessyouella blattaphilus]MDL2250936.1 C-GCAxxG-C-C family protein [Lachnospiraceae bacterium OttesenSCG-928-J05]
MNKDVDMKALKADAIDIFNNGFACSEAVIYAIRKHFDLAIPDDAIAMSSGFPWGLGGGGCICGALAGGTMCLGYVYGRRKPGEDNSKVFELTNKLHQHFKETHGSTCCRVLTKGMEKASPERKAHCTTMVADTVEYVATLL